MNNINPFTVEHVAFWVIRERSADDTLYIYNVENGYPVTIDYWAKDVQTVLENWPPNRPCRMMHDLHKIGQAIFSEHMRDRLAELFVVRPELQRQVAFILPHDTDLEAMQLAIMRHKLLVSGHYLVHWQLFTSRREALRWVLSAKENL